MQIANGMSMHAAQLCLGPPALAATTIACTVGSQTQEEEDFTVTTTPYRHIRRLILAVACVAVATLAPQAQASPSISPYVALGDSFSAASGVLPPDSAAPFQCLRSTRNYPKVIATTTGAQLTDVTCGAAETGDFFSPQYDNVAPQLDALTNGTRLVTMTIGGNDSGVFINAIISCGSAGLLTAGQGSPCKDQYGSSFEDTIRNTTYPSLLHALSAVRSKAPHAKVAILGYPWLLPPTGGCFPVVPVAQGDVPYLRGVQATLNDAVRRAAAATGVTYVDFTTVSEGHDACKPIGVRWIEPVLTGEHPVIMHPNALGEAKMAAEAIEALPPLGQAAALRKCKKKHSRRARKNCRRKALAARKCGKKHSRQTRTKCRRKAHLLRG
jgi:lysophospholipase L1-like esterase